MHFGKKTFWTISAIVELVRYDIQDKLFGLPGNYRGLQQLPQREARLNVPELADSIAFGMANAISFYWKRVRCLQRSLAITRLYRKYGIAAQLIIGCRPVPFVSHAWVEVGGQVVNDSPTYRQNLEVLDRVPEK